MNSAKNIIESRIAKWRLTKEQAVKEGGDSGSIDLVIKELEDVLAAVDEKEKAYKPHPCADFEPKSK